MIFRDFCKALLIFLMMSLSAAWAGVQTNTGEPFAVVELFTSEGCSSCPPADKLLIELTQAARSQGKRIFTLSFHVDYWNRLGWVDPFSSPQYTSRQYEYASVLEKSSVYTPQMIINGTQAFVGSNKNLAQKYIDQSLQTFSANKISLEIKNNDSSQIEINYLCQQLDADTFLNFALVERGLESNVTRGENSGQNLKHDNVVREFKSSPLKQVKGVITFQRPITKDLSRFSIIGYLQNAKNMKISAAQSVDLF